MSQGHLDKDLAWLDLNLFALGPPESAWNCHLYSSQFFTLTKKLCQNFPHQGAKMKMTIKDIKIYVRINHYLAVGAYVHGVHSEGKIKSKRFKRCKLQTVLM